MIFVTGDTHGWSDSAKLISRNFPEQKELCKKDYLIICGDFGFVWDNGKADTFGRGWLNTRNYTSLFCDGNHENFDLLNQYPMERNWNGGKVHRIQSSVIHLMRGQIFRFDGFSFFVMGGASSDDKDNRIEGANWWKEELPSEDEYAEAITALDHDHWKVDFVITHTLPSRFLKSMNIDRPPSPIEGFLDNIENQLEFRHWYCGHFHFDAELDSKHTILYNKVKCIDQ